MFSPNSVRDIIRISLQPITATSHPLYSPDAEEILLMISCHESLLGKHLRQMNEGEAFGLFGVERKTAEDNYTNFIDSRRLLAEQIELVTGAKGYSEQQLQFNPLYGAIHARIKLYRSDGPLPPAHDLPAMAAYAKRHYNSPLGAATPEKYLDDYHRLVLAA